MKHLSFIAVLFVLVSCATAFRPQVKVYYALSGGLERKQSGEHLSYVQAKGYLCEQAKDFRLTVACLGWDKKAWFIDPTIGFIQKETREAIPFGGAPHFYCLNPDDFTYLISRCNIGSM